MKRSPLRRSRKVTGFSRATKALIHDRDGHTCVVQMLCHGEEHDPRRLVANHVENRGLGGSTDPDINSVANGITTCWLDNGWLEDYPLIAYKYGWKRRRGAPSFGVLYPSGEWFVLLPSGSKRAVAAPEDVAS